MGLMPPAHSAVPIMDSKNGLPTLAPLLQDVTPAVVNISVQTRSAMEENPLFQGSRFSGVFSTFPTRRSALSKAPDRA